MKITVGSSKVVKPAYGGGDAPSAATFVPLTVFDLISCDEYMFGIHAFHPPSPPTAALEAGLATALADYREWAGRLRVDPATGRRGILLNDAGVRFVEAAADAALDGAAPLQPTPEVRRFHPRAADAGGDGELMLVQVTRFPCGSLVVGYAMNHAVGDGFAIAQFLVAWGQATRGVAIDPAPVHDRASLFVPRHPPRVEFEHRGAEFIKPPRDDKTNTETETQFFFTMGYCPADGVVYILPPSPLADGSVEAHVSLFRRGMETFKSCCFSVGDGDSEPELVITSIQ